MVEQSVLKPIDASTLRKYEAEGKVPWLVRQLAESLTARVVMASFETIRATGNSVVCLSPWGDSSPLLLPCIRFRDLALIAIASGTGGGGDVIVAHTMTTVSHLAVISSEAACNVTAQLVVSVGKHAASDVIDWILVDKPLDQILGSHADKVQDKLSTKEILITLKYKHVAKDAALGFFRSSEHGDSDPESSMFSKMADYLAVQNGWFSPYLFASGRRQVLRFGRNAVGPLIPRSSQADVVFAHGPFLRGDYKVAETLLAESVFALHFCELPSDGQKGRVQEVVEEARQDTDLQPSESKLTSLKAQTKRLGKKLFDKEPDAAERSEPPGPRLEPELDGSSSDPDRKEGVQEAVGEAHQDIVLQQPESKLTSLKAQTKRLGKKLFDKEPDAAERSELAGPPLEPEHAGSDSESSSDLDPTDLDPLAGSSTSDITFPDRRMIILLLGIKPYRVGAWTSSGRPGESVIRYILFSSCPTIVVPVKPGSPLVAWDTLTLRQLDRYRKDGKGAEGVVKVLLEYVELCVDWERMVVPSGESSKGDLDGEEEELKRESIKDALTLLVETAMKVRQDQDVKKRVEADRAGVVFFRLP